MCLAAVIAVASLRFPRTLSHTHCLLIEQIGKDSAAPHCTLHIAHCTLRMGIVHCTIRIAHYTLWIAHYALRVTHYELHITNCTLRIVHCTLHIADRPLHTASWLDKKRRTQRWRIHLAKLAQDAVNISVTFVRMVCNSLLSQNDIDKWAILRSHI